jgi:hypothetical protein
VLNSLFNPGVFADRDGDVGMLEGAQFADPSFGGETVITLDGDDELSDIPVTERAKVAAEIKAFRDRSTRRDMDRLKREEEMEARERNSNSRGNRHSPPPISAPSGPAMGTNNIPLGPRERGIHNAPSGPRGARQQGGGQNGVAFVNGNSAALSNYITKEEEESDASDEELERRRRKKIEDAEEHDYNNYVQRWANRERHRAAAMDREKARNKQDKESRAREKEAITNRLREWNDDIESERRADTYYHDHSLWLQNRATIRSREKKLDDEDRAKEELEQAGVAQAHSMADSFLDRQAEELSARGLQTTQEPQRFKFSLGAAAQKAQQAAAPKLRVIADVEGLLDTEEEVGSASKRTLVPIQFDPAAEAASLTPAEREKAQKDLASSIPTDKEALWKWSVQWEFLDDSVITEKLTPFVGRKIMEYLGVQEQMLVEVVEDNLRKRCTPQTLVKELEAVSVPSPYHYSSSS